MPRRRKPARRSPCPIACALDLIGDRWTLLVVRDLACGKTQFSEMCRSPEGIATNILADRLHRLVDAGLVERVASSAQPGRDVYRLTDKGRSLGPVMQAIARWGLAHVKGAAAHLTPRFGR